VDTTIKVESSVRDRLARIVAERGTSIRELLAQFANCVATDDELADRARAATDYVRDRISPDLSEADLAAADAFWLAIEAGRLPDASAFYPIDHGTDAA
jgi:hypothetical protein